jgi:hypothetical protein
MPLKKEANRGGEKAGKKDGICIPLFFENMGGVSRW